MCVCVRERERERERRERERVRERVFLVMFLTDMRNNGHYFEMHLSGWQDMRLHFLFAAPFYMLYYCYISS